MVEYTDLNFLIKNIELMSKKYSLYIVGAGRYGKIAGSFFDTCNFRWEGYIDIDDELVEVNGKKVFGYEKVTEDNTNFYFISSYSHRNMLAKQLQDRGVEEEKIGILSVQSIFFDMYHELVNCKKYAVKILKYKNKYNGKKCFIIGNGPSLQIDDLEKIMNEYTFASNGIYALYKHTKWRPRFYCAWDRFFCQEKMEDLDNINELMDGCEAAFTSIESEGFKFRDQIENLYYLKECKGIEPGEEVPLFSDDCLENVYTIGTITYAMLQLAVYMGFKEIILLGIDFSFSVERMNDGTFIQNNVQNHMDIIEEVESKSNASAKIKKIWGYSYSADIERQLAGYQAAKQYADSHGIKIYNATRGGKLEVFPRVNFDNLL